MSVFGPGIHEVSAEQYHSDPTAVPSLSASIAKILVKSTPMHAWAAHPRLNPSFKRVEKETFDLGNTVHALILEGDDSRVQVLEFDSWRSKDAREARDAARAEGKTPLLAKDYEEVEVAVESIRAQIMACDLDPPLFADGKPEQTLVWEDRGVTCRALVDWLHDDFRMADDLKSTSTSANPVVWSRRQMIDIGGHIQAIFNGRGIKALTGQDAAFRFVVAETSAPYAISVVSLDPAWRDLAEAMVDSAIDRWRTCLETDRWPGYPQAVYHAEPPAWVELAFMEMHAEALNA